jgi:hypothetical protein
MRAIQVTINEDKRTIVKEVDIKSYKDYYPLIGSSLFDVVSLDWVGQPVSIFLDDEGLLKHNYGRLVMGYPDPLFGNLVVAGGVDSEGKTLPLSEMFTLENIQVFMTNVMFEVN